MTPAPVAELAGIVLAAGAAQRFGALKQLLDWSGATLVQVAVQRALRVCGAGVVVVTGAAAEAVAASVTELDLSRVELVHNGNWRDGMGASLAAGAAALDTATLRGVLVTLVDQPGIAVDDLVHLAELWQTAPDRPACARFAGRLGAPAILPVTWLPELQQLSGDSGARALLAAADPAALDIPAAALDIDTPADWAALQAQQNKSDE